MKKVLGFFVIALIVVLIYLKETDRSRPEDVKSIFDKVTNAVALQQKLPKETITLNSRFDRDLNFKNYDHDTLALKLNDTLGLELDLDKFRKLNTVGEAVDFVRLEIKKDKKLKPVKIENK